MTFQYSLNIFKQYMYITTSTEKRIRYSVTMQTIQYGLVNSAMGQIPCSPERISYSQKFSSVMVSAQPGDFRQEDRLWRPTSTWMPSPPRRSAVTVTFDPWPPKSNQVISSGLLNIPVQFYRHCSSRSRDIMVTISDRTKERTNARRTARKHGAFADTVE